jgi:RHS repeat-associated protein
VGTYQYDDEGNITFWFGDNNSDDQWEWGEVGVSYTWDYRNRLASQTVYDFDASYETDFIYDAFDRLVRVDEVDNGYADTYVYDGNQVALYFSGTRSDASASDLRERVLWGPATDQLLAQEWTYSLTSAGTIDWALADYENTVRDIVRYNSGSDTTSVAGHVQYGSFGQMISTSWPGFAVQFGYTGRLYVDGLQYNGHRWYNAYLGRFLSQDPIEDGSNPYEYARNSPGNYVDPTGLDADNLNLYGDTSPPEMYGYTTPPEGLPNFNPFPNVPPGALVAPYKAPEPVVWPEPSTAQLADEALYLVSGFERALGFVGRKVISSVMARAEATAAVSAAEEALDCPKTPRANPGVIKNNPANKLIETGIPRKDGGWLQRWIRMNDADHAKWLRGRSEYYNHVNDLSHRMRLDPDVARRFRFQQMQQWRENYLDDFLQNRKY